MKNTGKGASLLQNQKYKFTCWRLSSHWVVKTTNDGGVAGHIFLLGGFSGCSGVRFASVPTRGAWAPGPSHPGRALFIWAVRVSKKISESARYPSSSRLLVSLRATAHVQHQQRRRGCIPPEFTADGRFMISQYIGYLFLAFSLP